jgi:holo-[acyl-carrier protein] synthase
VALVDVDEAEALLARDAPLWSAAELTYARARVDPARRLAARLAAKRAACRLLPGIAEADVEVVRGEYGPPALRLSSLAATRLAALGADRVLVSLTHERRRAAAMVVLLGPER